MIVCLCNRFNDKDVRSVTARGGVHSAGDAYRALGGEVCCGCCIDCANEIISEELSKSPFGLAAE